MQNKANLLNSQMNVSRVLTKGYGNNSAFRPIKTKPKQSQFKPNTKPNKANLRNAQNERKLSINKGL